MNAKFEQAFNNAVMLMEAAPDLEIKSALKQCASDVGIKEGEELMHFVIWGIQELGLEVY